MLGDEYSTIARLTEYKHDPSYTNNNSMVDSSMYSVHRVDVDTSMFSLSGAEAAPIRQESQVCCDMLLCVKVGIHAPLCLVCTKIALCGGPIAISLRI